METEALLIGLDADQRTAVTDPGAPIAIIAAAGSGKTTVLTRRIAYRLATDPDVLGQHVLALTFTSQAAQELQRRLRRAGLRERIEAGTFHAVALRLLRQRAIDNSQQPPQVASDRKRLVTEALRAIGSAYDAGQALDDLDWARARRVPYTDFVDAARRAGRIVQPGATQLAAIAAAYADVKRRRGVVDFDDLLEHCLTAMATDKMWAAGVRWRFRHLFVDEAQDLNPLQFALLESIRNGRLDICIVGDPRQAIFGFNGSDPAILHEIEERYPGITIVRLRRNYRCTPQIIDASRRVLERSGQRDDSIAVALDGPQPRIVTNADDAAENLAVASIVRDLAGTHRPWLTCAVLARTTQQLRAVATALARAGVPTTTYGGANTSKSLKAALAEAYGQRQATELGTWVDQVTASSGVDAVRARVAEAADRYLAQWSGMSFRAWVELHSPFDDLDSDEPDDGVELLTFHGAKGREWPSVVIIGVEAGLVPHSSAITTAQREEEARLLYVACTRARENLVVSWAQRRRDRAAKQSPLIAGLVDADPEYVGPPVTRPKRAEPDPVYLALVKWRHTAAIAAQVEPTTICSDESLRAVAHARPSTVEAVAALTDLGPIAASRIAPRLLDALNRAL